LTITRIGKASSMAEQQHTGAGKTGEDAKTGEDGKIGLDREAEEHTFVDQSAIDFDPDEGLYSGTAVDGTSEIPGPHIDAESGELEGMDEIRQQAEEGGIDPSDTPAAKSPVARVAEGGSAAEPGSDRAQDE
jgi:hypothetical protein